MFPAKSGADMGGAKKKPAFLRKSAPMPPSDGEESGEEMMAEHNVTCPECGCEFDPMAEQADAE